MRNAYRFLSLVNMFAALFSGKPARVRRYVRNRAKARLLARSGFWR